MLAKKIIAVVGATGNQGGSVVDAILADKRGEFSVRAITRDPTKEKARALAARGAEVVKADLDDPPSLTRAFTGAHGAFGVTNFWEHASAERESKHARTIAAAAKSARVQHVVWSTLEDSRPFMPPGDARMPMLQGRYRVPNHDGKAEADAAFAGLPVTFLLLPVLWDVVLLRMAPRKGPDGVHSWAVPMGDAKLAGIAVPDVGKVVHRIFQDGAKHRGRTVGVVSERLTFREMSDRLSDVMGYGPVRYDAVDPAAYRAFGFPGAEILGNMWQFYRDFEKQVGAARSEATTRSLVPDVATFEQCARRLKPNIPV